MQDLLTLSGTRSLSTQTDQLLSPTQARKEEHGRDTAKLHIPEDVLDILKSKPGLEDLIRCMKWISTNGNGFDIRSPGPHAAQIIHVIVNETVPNYWHIWRSTDSSDYDKPRKLLKRCLTSVAGLGAVVMQLRTLSSDIEVNQGTEKSVPILNQSAKAKALSDLIDLLERLLAGHETIQALLAHIKHSGHTTTLTTLLWKELVSLLASGKLLSVVAEADSHRNNAESRAIEKSWLADGPVYSRWLGRNIHFMILQMDRSENPKDSPINQIINKALTLGYTGCSTLHSSN
jgi:telomere length regulation protein